MNSSVRELLLGPSRIELQRECDDRTVFGGYAKFVLKHLGRLSTDEPNLKLALSIFHKKFSDYLVLEIPERKRLVIEFINLLSNKVTNKSKHPWLNLSLDDLITKIPNVGQTRAKELAKLGIKTIDDAIKHFPTRYLDRSRVLPISKLRPGDEISIVANVLDLRPPRPGRNFVQAVFGDNTGKILATWFNTPYIQKKLVVGTKVMVSGKVGDYGGPHLTNPDIDVSLSPEEMIIPIYPSKAEVSQWLIRWVIKEAIFNLPDVGKGFIPEKIITTQNYPSLTEAYKGIHCPENLEQSIRARNRLAFDELLLLESALLLKRAQYKAQDSDVIEKASEYATEFYCRLPFKLTNAQKHCSGEISADLESGHPMNRLLHGDVGSGKTVVGLSACYGVIRCNLQAAWIAPTEVLATQTFNTATKLIGDKVCFLTGSTRKKVREEIFARLNSGEPLLLVGTHAVLEDWVSFQNLALAVVDEQHRFGVLQRARLAKKAKNPHILVMSATPIPRTLAMTLYGDLDVSVIDEMPTGRIPVQTKVLETSGDSAYKKALQEIKEGHQVFVVCPLVVESEKLEAKAATTHFEELSSQHFKGIKCALLHGRMKSAEKDAVMKDFNSGQTKVLISTTVIEVGIDVPNATVMIIENADRFGLAQLHQLRGRIGRGQWKSFCFLLPGRTSQALQILERTNNGLEVAEEDLKLRGPGDFGGTMQSGVPMLDAFNLITPSNLGLLGLARKVAIEILKADPDLSLPEHKSLREAVRTRMAERVGLAWVS